MKLLRSKYLYLFIGILSLTLSFQNCARESFKSLDGNFSESSTTSASSVESNSNATGSDKQNTSQSNQSSGSSGGASQFPNSQVRQPASPSSPSPPMWAHLFKCPQPQLRYLSNQQLPQLLLRNSLQRLPRYSL